MFFSLSKNQSIISFNWPGKTGSFIKRTDLFSLKRLLFLNRALPVSFIGDRFALRSLHQSFISSSLPACPLCTAFVINVEQLKSLTWVQARPVFLWAYSLLSQALVMNRMMEGRGTGTLSLQAACVKGVFLVFITLMLIGQNLTLYLSNVFLHLPYNLYLFGLSFCLLSGYTDERYFVISFSIVFSSLKSFSSVN